MENKLIHVDYEEAYIKEKHKDYSVVYISFIYKGHRHKLEVEIDND